jgi:hypothetical protein
LDADANPPNVNDQRAEGSGLLTGWAASIINPKGKSMAHHTITENGNTVNCYEYSIKTEDEYKVVLSAIDKLMDIDPPAGSIPGDILL